MNQYKQYNSRKANNTYIYNVYKTGQKEMFAIDETINSC